MRMMRDVNADILHRAARARGGRCGLAILQICRMVAARACGGGPSRQGSALDAHPCGPRARGWTRREGCRHYRHPVRPARAGVDSVTTIVDTGLPGAPRAGRPSTVTVVTV